MLNKSYIGSFMKVFCCKSFYTVNVHARVCVYVPQSSVFADLCLSAADVDVILWPVDEARSVKTYHTETSRNLFFLQDYSLSQATIGICLSHTVYMYMYNMRSCTCR